MSAASRLDTGLSVVIYSGSTTLPGTGGGSVAPWALVSGSYPRFAVLEFTNNGAGVLTLGDGSKPITFLADGVTYGFLFEGRQVILAPGESVITRAPADAGAVGTGWNVTGSVSSPSTVNVRVVATPIVSVETAAASASVDQSSIQSAMTAQGYTSVRAALLDNVDVAVSTRTSGSLSVDVAGGLNTQGYTALRAARLDNLDSTVSSRMAVTQLSGALDVHGYTSARAAALDSVSGILSAVGIQRNLLNENSYMDQQVYDSDGNLTSARVRSYDTAANAATHGSTGLLNTFAMTATYSGPARCTSYLLVRQGS